MDLIQKTEILTKYCFYLFAILALGFMQERIIDPMLKTAE